MREHHTILLLICFSDHALWVAHAFGLGKTKFPLVILYLADGHSTATAFPLVSQYIILESLGLVSMQQDTVQPLCRHTIAIW